MPTHLELAVDRFTLQAAGSGAGEPVQLAETPPLGGLGPQLPAPCNGLGFSLASSDCEKDEDNSRSPRRRPLQQPGEDGSLDQCRWMRFWVSGDPAEHAVGSDSRHEREKGITCNSLIFVLRN